MKKILSFIRWRIIGVRYITMFGVNSFWRKFNSSSFLTVTSNIERLGYSQGPKINKEYISDIINLYQPRISNVQKKEKGAPFFDLMLKDDINVNNPILKITFSKEIFDVAVDYFGGKATLTYIQLLYSWPTSDSLRESQMWHKDFGDNKSFHAIIYINDVLTDDDGPFVFANKSDSKKIGKSLLVRRIPDNEFINELGSGKIEKAFGESGYTIFVDPAVCYHFGSRCKNPRLAIFITFNTNKPFVPSGELILNNSEILFKVAKELRPDLSQDLLKQVIGV